MCLAPGKGPLTERDGQNIVAQFRSFSQGVQVNGQTVLSVVNGMGAFAATGKGVLERHGIKAPDAAAWYPQQAWLDAFQEIAQSIGPRTLSLIGQSIPKNARFPPGIDTVEKALASLNAAYHMNHRGGDIGRYAFTKTGPKAGVMECRNPYPCEFDSGIIQAVLRRFGAVGAKVTHDASKPCRSKQGDSCTLLISW